MFRKLIFVALVLGLVSYASAATVVLSDSDLQSFVDFGWNQSTLDAITDIPGDPGTQYDVTLGATGGWSDIAIGIYSGDGVNIGDTWEQTFYNPDAYPTAVYLFMQVDGWVYNQGPGAWVNPGATATISIVNPATTGIDAMGIKIGSDAWTGRPDGSSLAIQVIPEPATLMLLGLGGMLLRRRRS